MGWVSRHVHTIRLLVWHTFEDFTAILTSSVGQRRYHVTRTWTNQYRMTDEHRNFGTIFNSRDDYSINMGLYGESRGGGDGQEDNVATLEVHQSGGDV
jgi:hypothetical protein